MLFASFALIAALSGEFGDVTNNVSVADSYGQTHIYVELGCKRDMYIVDTRDGVMHIFDIWADDCPDRYR